MASTSMQSAKHSSSGDPPTTRWGRTGDPGSAFNGLDKPANRGRGHGRGRGGRRGIGKSSPHTGAHSTHSASPIQKSNSTSGSSQVTTSPPSPNTTKAERASASSLNIPNPPPQITYSPVPPAVPSMTEPTTQSRAPTKSQYRRRRSNASRNSTSQQSPGGAESRTRKHRPPELSPSLLAPYSAQTNTASPPSSANASSDVKANIDAFVERVRASAMANHRPGTPGSHIDWADDDDSLPDLNDWGIQSPAPLTSHAMISPILVDGLTPLPESASFPQNLEGPRESTDVPEPIDIPQLPNNHPVADGAADSDQPSVDKRLIAPESQANPIPPTQALMHPSLPPKPASPMPQHERHPRSRSHTNKNRMKTPVNGTVPQNNAPISAAPKTLTINQNQESRKELGLSASIHAPVEPEANRSNGPSCPDAQTSVPINANPTHHDKSRARDLTHSRAHTVGRPSSFNHHVHSTTSGSGMSHARSQSSPTLAKNNGRSSHRPILTGDAMAKLAKTIGGATSRSIPLSTPAE